MLWALPRGALAHTQMPPSLLWLNGEFMPLEQGAIAVEDRGFQFADGIYEVVAFPGREPLLLEEHLDRWERSASGLELEPWLSRSDRRAVVMELAARSPWPDTMVYGQLTRGSSPRAHAFPSPSTKCTELWYAKPLPAYPPEYHASGVSVITHPDERWRNCHLKTVSLLPNCLAKERARRAGAFEVLFVNEAGWVTEGAAVNAWAVLDGVARTHPLTNAILPGITRQFVLLLASESGIACEERAFGAADLPRASELFLTSTTIGVLPVTRVDGAPVGDGEPGPVTAALLDAYRRRLARPPRVVVSA